MNITDKILVQETTNWKIQFIRYVFVGGISFVVDYGLLYILTEFAHLHYLISATISFLAATALSPS